MEKAPKQFRHEGFEWIPQIEAATNWDELYSALREVGGVQGSGQYYDAEFIIQQIDNVRAGRLIVNMITTRGGVRIKVVELLLKDKETNQ